VTLCGSDSYRAKPGNQTQPGVEGNKEKDSGYYKIVWNGLDKNGLEVGTGVYLVQMKADEFIATRKMLLIK